MKPVKFAIPLISLLGLIGLFVLPYVSEEGLSMSAWKLSKQEIFGESNAVQAYVVIAGFAVALLMGILAIAKNRMARWQGIVALIFSALVLLPGLTRDSLRSEVAIGGKVIFFAAVAAIILSILAIVKPDRNPLQHSKVA